MKCEKCNRELPPGSKHKECERCRAKKANAVKAIGGAIIGLAGTVISIANKIKK